MTDLEDFGRSAEAWIAANKRHAPPDYGAILPPGLVDRGVEWQKRLFDEGWAGIHWPTDFGGRGLGRFNRSSRQLECRCRGRWPS
jgi:alkylation response protein AidB-like acyl-CoA dehydrogenase